MDKTDDQLLASFSGFFLIGLGLEDSPLMILSLCSLVLSFVISFLFFFCLFVSFSVLVVLPYVVS